MVRLGAILGQLVYVKIYSHHLSNYELGIYFYLMTISYFLNALVFVPVDYYQQSRLYPFRDADISLAAFLRFNKWLLLLIGAITALVTLPCLFLGRIIAIEAVACVSMSVALYVTTAFKNLLNNLDHKLMVAAIFLVEVVLKTGLFYAATRVLTPHAIILIGSNILSLLLVLPLLAVTAQRRGIFRSGSAHTISYCEVAIFSYPLSIAAIANWLQLQGYRLVLVPFGYTEIVGIYGTVANVGVTIMNAVSIIYGQLYSPKLYQTHGSSLKTYLGGALLLILVVLAGGGALSERIIPLLTRQDLGRYSHLLLYGVGTEAGNFLAGGLAIYLTVKNKTRAIMNGSFLGVAAVAISATILCMTGRARIYTIGLPLILSQVVVVTYMASAWQIGRGLAATKAPLSDRDI